MMQKQIADRIEKIDAWLAKKEKLFATLLLALDKNVSYGFMCVGTHLSYDSFLLVWTIYCAACR